MVQIYTGEGKGKTTAALGLTLRACGHGMRVFIAQFAKGMAYGELESMKRFAELVTLRQYGRRCFIHDRPEEEDIRLAQRGWTQVREAAASGLYDILVLDELGIALHYGLVSLEQVEELIQGKAEALELVITGRKVPESLFALADLVTEMRAVKHYYTKGVKARKGIEY